MLVFIFKTFASEGEEVVHLSKHKALQPKNPFNKQLKAIHSILAAKPHRGPVLQTGKAWAKGSQAPGSAAGLVVVCCGVRVSSRVVDLAEDPTRSAQVCPHPALAGLPKSCQWAKSLTLGLLCVFQKIPVPPRPCLAPCQAPRPEITQV